MTRRFLALELLDNRYPQLHGLRVLAIVSVLQFHVTSIFALEQEFHFDREWVISSFTVFFGMDLFFILSGFLIGSILIHAMKHRSSRSHPVRRFYLRRIFRTFPPYYVVLTILAVLHPLTVEQRKHLWMEYTYLTNFTGTRRQDTVMFWGWSLGLEEQFYLVVPLLLVGLSRLRTTRAQVTLLLLLWAAALAVRLGIYFSHSWVDTDLRDAIYFRTYTRFDTLVSGILLAVLHDRLRVPIGRWLVHPFHRALVALPSLFCLWALLQPWKFMPHHRMLFDVFAWGTLTSIMYGGFLTLLLHGKGPSERVLSAPIFRRIATLGYGVYLVHIPLCDRFIVPVAHAMDDRHVSLFVVWSVSLVLLLALSLAVSYALHVLVEKPSLWIRNRVAA